MAGEKSASTRLSSISSPVSGRSNSKLAVGEHPLEHVEALAHLLAVPLALLAGVPDAGHLVTHERTQP